MLPDSDSHLLCNQRCLQFMRGNMLVLTLSNLLGNFSRAMVFPYTSLFILALGGDAAQIVALAIVVTIFFIRDPQRAEA